VANKKYGFTNTVIQLNNPLLFIISSSEDSNEITMARHNLKNLPPNPICGYSIPLFSNGTNTPENVNVEKTMKMEHFSYKN
jgi:hypothetical protein